MIKKILFFAMFALIICACNNPKLLEITDKVKSIATDTACEKLKLALEKSTNNTSFKIEVQIDSTMYTAEEFSIERKGNTISITGGDNTGAMYGIFELTEQVEFGKDLHTLKDIHKKPFIKKRGVKINIPLDARLPSYDDTGDAAQQNIKEMWSMEFWKAHIDNLAKHRYNLITLWSKHPFPGMIKLKNYPEMAMDDVYVLNKEITSKTHKDFHGIDFYDTKNLTLIKKISIDEKIAFWKEVMQYGHDKGIEFILFTWNIYYANADKLYNMSRESKEARVYMKECVRVFTETYPHLSGIGVTAGEHMKRQMGDISNIQWMSETYGKGVNEALKNNPERDFRFIFRRHGTTLPAIDKDFKPHFTGLVETGYKYSSSHIYSNTEPPFYDRDYAADVEKYGYNCWMHLRNEDLFVFRWGDPNFVRSYIKKMQSYNPPGFFMGSDGYVWGREYNTKIPALSGQLEIEKHWFRFLLWGRLAYDPTLKDNFFTNKIATHFPTINGKVLYNAWQKASEIIPLTTNFHWQSLDAMWAPEVCMEKHGFHSVQKFIDSYTNDPTKIINIPNYVNKINTKEKITKITPIEVADSLLHIANNAKKNLELLKTQNNSVTIELQATLDDIQCQTLLGNYYGHKIHGATHLHFLETVDDLKKKEKHRNIAIQHMESALKYWKQFVTLADKNYKPQLLARTKQLDWKATIKDVEKDIELVKSSNGKPSKIAKILYTNNHLTKTNTERLEKVLIEKGYKVKKLKRWFADGQAAGLNLVFCNYDDKDTKFFTDRGGVINEIEMDKKGFSTINHQHKFWLFSKNISTQNKLVDEWVKKIRENKLDLR